jgi:3-oxoacyl-[acyl-carrier-protein] synthase III
VVSRDLVEHKCEIRVCAIPWKENGLPSDSILEIVAYGAWNGGQIVDNSIFSGRGMFFKGNVPVNNETIEKRIGVRKRVVAPKDERIGVTALKDLLEKSDLDASRIKVVIGATNVGEDKYDPGPLVRHPFKIVERKCPDAIALDLYAGCPGFNVSAELIFMLSLAGVLGPSDLSVIVGAENIHRAGTFKPLDTAHILFGDDAVATALETKTRTKPVGTYSKGDKIRLHLGNDFVMGIARAFVELNGVERIDGIIVDNQLGKMYHRIPAAAARIQHRLVELMYPQAVSSGMLARFKDALAFYDENVKSFGFDIMSMGKDPSLVERIARAYVESGKYKTIASAYLAPDFTVEAMVHKGDGYNWKRPRYGIVDTLTRTHGCFGDYIQALFESGDVFAEIDGKGVFLYATRGAKAHLTELLSRNQLTLQDIDLLIEHQANFAMIPLTLERSIENGEQDKKKMVQEYIAKKMVTNIHERGNCSVVCMQRLPYDLKRGALKTDTIQGYPVNRNLDNLKNAKVVLNDSVGTGMTRSSILQINR